MKELNQSKPKKETMSTPEELNISPERLREQFADAAKREIYYRIKGKPFDGDPDGLEKFVARHRTYYDEGGKTHFVPAPDDFGDFSKLEVFDLAVAFYQRSLDIQQSATGE